jgi:3-phosphoshikimate 1-carboxyvinyltransferase
MSGLQCQKQKQQANNQVMLVVDTDRPKRLNYPCTNGSLLVLRSTPNFTHKEQMPTTLTAKKSRSLQGRVRVPGDKSISHRSLILGALSTGTTKITGLLEGEDVLATGEALATLGAGVEKKDDTWIVHGRGVGGLGAQAEKLDFGNSGTGARLMMGAIAGQNVRMTFTGDESLSRRPMGRVLNPLKLMGLNCDGESDMLPLTLSGSSDLVPIEYELPVPSAQVKSAILLAGLHAPGKTTVIETAPTRDHTERMLSHFGAELVISQDDENRTLITVTGDAELEGRDVTVPGDPSSAAFLAAAVLITQGSQITIEGVLVNPSRIGLYETLKEMGANLEYQNLRDEGGEPVADIQITSGPLKGINVPASRAPSMIDEYPILAVVAAFASGETRMDGIGELRVKESDRLAATLAGLKACGVEAEAGDDSLSVHGGNVVPGGGYIETHMDHRIAMAFLIMGLGAEKPVTVDNAEIIATSFPDFTELMQSLGAQLQNTETPTP